MITLDHLTRRFGATVAVDSLTATIPAGAITALLGPNGAGKTTTLNLLTTLLEPSDGTANVAGCDLRGDGAGVRREQAITRGAGQLLHAARRLVALPAQNGVAEAARPRPAGDAFGLGRAVRPQAVVDGGDAQRRRVGRRPRPARRQQHQGH